MNPIDLWWRAFAKELSQWSPDRKFLAFAVAQADRALLWWGLA